MNVINVYYIIIMKLIVNFNQIIYFIPFYFNTFEMFCNQFIYLVLYILFLTFPWTSTIRTPV